MKIKALILGAIALVASSIALADGHVNLVGPGSLPENPEVGKCYVHKFFPPKYIMTEEEVLVKEEYKYYTKIPAVIGTTQIFHTYTTPKQIEIIDPVFETEKVQIMIRPDDPVWHVKCCADKKRPCKDRCPNPHHKHDVALGDNLKGDKMYHHKKKPCEQACFKAVRPIYKTYVVQRTVQDGSYEEFSGTNQILTFNVPTIEQEASVEEHIVPAEYMTFKVYTLDHPGYMKWVEGTCKKYVCNIRDLQKALADKGYFNGKHDGIIGPKTLKALNKFRADKGLDTSDEVDEATAEALGLKK